MLKDPTKRIHEIAISLFTSFKPMLAENIPIEEITERMEYKEFFIEVKYDGERMLAHRGPNGNFKFFSRNNNDFTDNFGHHPSSGKFCQFIEQALSPGVQSVILGMFSNTMSIVTIFGLKHKNQKFHQ